MTLVVADAAEVIIMENFLNITAPQDLILRLFTSNTTPAESDTTADYTEATDGGYTQVALVAGDWTIAAGTPTTASYPEITYVFDGAAGNIFGYYVVQAVSDNLLWSERFAGAPLNVQNNGDEIRITLQITLE